MCKKKYFKYLSLNQHFYFSLVLYNFYHSFIYSNNGAVHRVISVMFNGVIDKCKVLFCDEIMEKNRVTVFHNKNEHFFVFFVSI